MVLLTQVSEEIQVSTTRVTDADFAVRSDDPAIPGSAGRCDYFETPVQNPRRYEHG